MINIIKMEPTESLEKEPSPQKKDINLIEQIYADPNYFLKDEEALKEIVDTGFYSAALCDALGLEELTVEIDKTEYNLKCCKPPHGHTTYSVLVEDSLVNPPFRKVMVPDPKNAEAPFVELVHPKTVRIRNEVERRKRKYGV